MQYINDSRAQKDSSFYKKMYVRMLSVSMQCVIVVVVVCVCV